VNDVPGPDDMVQKDDILVVVGTDKNIEKMSIDSGKQSHANK
jgi:K+/H+ antiporter YhaU regulatory subunit KhtT